jgi:hypothetical protein
MGKVLYRVTLTQEEQENLTALTKKGKQSSRKLLHALYY